MSLGKIEFIEKHANFLLFLIFLVDYSISLTLWMMPLLIVGITIQVLGVEILIAQWVFILSLIGCIGIPVFLYSFSNSRWKEHQQLAVFLFGLFTFVPGKIVGYFPPEVWSIIPLFIFISGYIILFIVLTEKYS